MKIEGDGIKRLWAADPKKGFEAAFAPGGNDPYAELGNAWPRIVAMTAEEEQAILSDVKVPDGFEATVFAAPPAVNYPVFVAATVDGTLYVSSDGNGSLGQKAKRGRVIRLRDLDGDGRADEAKIFCNVDAPRGLVWDHDRLYLMHPPHLSAFIDHDGDGEADQQQILVKNLAFGYDKRPADHTTNGVSLGVDGWLYIAGGDFGFIDAEGTDGRKVTHRGGGVIRVRPDGTGLEIYSTGTRNILEVAISPAMEMFARDNTNDGGGWDVRLHHFTGMDDHGYPRLYKNFNDECVQPLADYGGGSGCGAVYIDEPGMGDWNNAPFTADWGTGALYRHTVSPSGSTYAETKRPEPFIRMTRPTDADVDGMSRVYCASWMGAMFDWAGSNVGYIVCVKPKDFKPEPLPNFATSSDAQLTGLLDSPSYRRRMETERELMRRGSDVPAKWLASIRAKRSGQRNQLESLQSPMANEDDPRALDLRCIDALSSDDPVIVHTAIRSLASRSASDVLFPALDNDEAPADRLLRSLAMIHSDNVVDGLIERLGQATPATKRFYLAALCRLHSVEGPWGGDSWGTRPDTRGPYYQPQAWAETDRINKVLKSQLNELSPDDSAWLIEEMSRNRIELDDALDRLMRLAKQDAKAIPPALAKLADADSIPPRGVSIAVDAIASSNVEPKTIADAVVTLLKTSPADFGDACVTSLVTGLDRIDTSDLDAATRNRVRERLNQSTAIENQVRRFAELAKSSGDGQGVWSDAILLTIAARPQASPEAMEIASQSIESGWSSAERRGRLMIAADKVASRYLDEKVLVAQSGADASLASLAASMVKKYKIEPKAIDQTPKVLALAMDEAMTSVISMHGDIETGRQVFTRANCIACHTVNENEAQKGPYLGTIARTYKRPELVAAILDPNKTIAQGFVTNAILTSEGTVVTGFVTNESSDMVVLRDQQGKEITVMKEDIEDRQTSPVSVMPSGLMNDYTIFEMSSLVDYLESLSRT